VDTHGERQPNPIDLAGAGEEPTLISRAGALGQGVSEQSHLKLNTIELSGRPTEAANLPHYPCSATSDTSWVDMPFHSTQWRHPVVAGTTGSVVRKFL